MTLKEPIEVDAYICPECFSEYIDEYDADDCCPKDIDSDVRFSCPVCHYLCIDYMEAKYCCQEDEE